MFKRGNIVKFKCGFWGDTNSPETGRLGVIQYSYGEKYGNGEIGGGYSVLDKETGCSSAWWYEEYLEFVSKGSEDEIKKCKEIANTIKERNENLDYIKSEILKGNLNLAGSSILKLFHEIDYISAFERNGEYYALYSDWEALSPIFVALFNKQYDIMVECLNVFKEEYRDNYKEMAINFYNRVNQWNQRFKEEIGRKF